MNDKCILIVDDDPQIRRMLQRFLLQEYANVIVASSAAEALTRTRQNSPDIILMDGRLRNPNGLTSLKEHLHESIRYRVIILTAFSATNNAEAAVRAEAYAYLPKPIDLGKLKIAIRNCLTLQAMARNLDKAPAIKNGSLSLRNFVGTSSLVLKLMEQIKRIAPYDIPVLILGESGTGKELLAQTLHSLSPRLKGPFTPIDCGAIPETLVESELFGYEPGAFSGASKLKLGKFEQAHNGTILMDEVGNLPIRIQSKLLRAIQSMQIERLGGNQPKPINARILAATNSNIEQMLKLGSFREDLYHRLNGVTITVPPLRERTEDIRLLAHYSLLNANRDYQTTAQGISEEAMVILERYTWPGNVRELENSIRSAAIQTDKTIMPSHLPERLHQWGLSHSKSIHAQAVLNKKREPIRQSLFQIGRHSLMEAERIAILETLHVANGNKAETARLLKTDYKSLREKIQKYKIT